MDYGLAYRYSPEGVPKEYKEDPKRCHDGTIEFTSIDAHHGVCVYMNVNSLINNDGQIRHILDRYFFFFF